MTKKRKKKIKVKHKKSIILIIVILLIICGVLSFLIIKNSNKIILKNIKNNYNKYVITKGNTKLYDKNKKLIGYIDKDLQIELEDIKNITIKNKYLKVKNSDNYIGYKNIKKIKKITDIDSNDNYIVFNKNIKSNNKINLYRNGKKVITLTNGINKEILYMDKDSYYVKYLNKTLSIKKDKKIKTIKKNNTSDKATDYISVLYYEGIGNNCEGNGCLDIENVKTQIIELKNNGYNLITKDEYIAFINDYIRLKEKSVFLTTGSETDEVKLLNDKYKANISIINDKDNIKFQNTNKKSTSKDKKDKLNRYVIKTYSSIDDILKMANGEDVSEEEINSNDFGIAVLNYHFFYDPNSQRCDEAICLEVNKFREHLQYLKDNGYKTLTMKEFVNWIYGKIDLPKKSVLITIDDGAMGTGKHNGNHLITLLEEYKMHATLFLIAGWWDISNYQSDYLEVQSHTFDMHKYGDCGRGQLVCANYDQAKADLQKSLDIIKDNTSFCYPFYSYDDEAIKAVKDLGFKVAFAGGNVKARRTSDKYKVPRYPIQSDITMQDFIKKIS